LVRDPRRARAARRADRGGPPDRHRKTGGLAKALRTRGARREARDRPRAGRVPRGAGIPGRAGGEEVTARIDKLRASLEEPLLVTNPTNIYYLFGFKSSNAALLVEPDGVRLFTDFRYAEAARGVEGVRFEETRRALLWDLAQRLSGPVGFEADYMSYAGWQALGSGAIEPAPRRGLVHRLPAATDNPELA